MALCIKDLFMNFCICWIFGFFFFWTQSLTVSFHSRALVLWHLSCLPPALIFLCSLEPYLTFEISCAAFLFCLFIVSFQSVLSHRSVTDFYVPGSDLLSTSGKNHNCWLELLNYSYLPILIGPSPLSSNSFLPSWFFFTSHSSY